MQFNLENGVINSKGNNDLRWNGPMFGDNPDEGSDGPVPVPYPPDVT